MPSWGLRPGRGLTPSARPPYNVEAGCEKMDKGIKEILQGVLWTVGLVLFVVAVWVIMALLDSRLGEGDEFSLPPLLSLIFGSE